jgi:tRNA dimethylallyltransferase
MLEAGWIDEVRALIRAGYRDARAMNSVGYRQIAKALDEDAIDVSDLERDIVRATRIFARRQRTWIRDEPVAWVSGSEL